MSRIHWFCPATRLRQPKAILTRNNIFIDHYVLGSEFVDTLGTICKKSLTNWGF